MYSTLMMYRPWALPLACLFATLVPVLASTGADAQRRNLIADGNFERPAVAERVTQTFELGQMLGPWTVVGSPGNVAVVGAGFERAGFTFPAAEGRQWIDLSGTSGTATGIAQAVPTVPGASYVLTFFVGKVNDPGGPFGRSSTVEVLIDGALAMSATNSLEGGWRSQQWQQFDLRVRARSAQTTIAFLNGDPSGDGDDGLDAVAFREAPEPGH